MYKKGTAERLNINIFRFESKIDIISITLHVILNTFGACTMNVHLGYLGFSGPNTLQRRNINSFT